jgi:hypothetical protein
VNEIEVVAMRYVLMPRDEHELSNAMPLLAVDVAGGNLNSFLLGRVGIGRTVDVSSGQMLACLLVVTTTMLSRIESQ